MQVTSRDEALQRLNVEVAKLRASRQEKLAESARQADMIRQLQEALSRVQVDLDDTRRRADEDVSRPLSLRDIGFRIYFPCLGKILKSLIRDGMPSLSSSHKISGPVPVCWLLFQCFVLKPAKFPKS